VAAGGDWDEPKRLKKGKGKGRRDLLDEALTGFLALYNPIVRQARAVLGWWPMPEFTFGVWLTGLIVLVGVLLALSPFAFRGAPAMRVAAYPYATIMLLNGIGHLGASVYLGRWAPGATTAPLLIVSSLWLFKCSTRT
jgi:hypothetical protein